MVGKTTILKKRHFFPLIDTRKLKFGKNLKRGTDKNCKKSKIQKMMERAQPKTPQKVLWIPKEKAKG